MKKFSIVTVTLMAVSLPLVAKSVITDKRIQECYTQYPFFFENIALVSDADFMDAKKANERKSKIANAFKKNPTEIKQCLEDLLQYSKDQNKPADLNYTAKRLSEVTAILAPEK